MVKIIVEDLHTSATDEGKVVWTLSAHGGPVIATGVSDDFQGALDAAQGSHGPWEWDADADTWRLPLGDVELRVQPGEHGFDWTVSLGFAVLANDRHTSLQAAKAAAIAWVKEASLG